MRKISHLRQCSLNIANANESIVIQAVALLAKEYGRTTTVTEVTAMSREATKVLAGIEGMNGRYAYGVRVDGGKIEVVGDDWNAVVSLAAFQKRVTQAYQAVVYQSSMLKQGFRTHVQRTGNKYVLTGARA